MTKRSPGGLVAVARDSLLLAPSYVVPGIASLVSVPVLFNALGADGYGRWALIFAIANGVPQVTASWLESVVLRFGHRPDAAIRTSYYVAAPIASAVVGLALAMVFIPGASPLVVGATAMLTAAVGTYLVVTAQLQSLLRFGAASRVAIVRATLGAILSIVAATVARDAAVAAIGLAIGFAVGSIDGLIVVRRHRAREITSTAPIPAIDGGLRAYGVGSLVFAVGSFVLAVGDRFVLSMLRPLAEVGVYAATYSIADLLFRLAPSVLVATVRQRLFRSWDAAGGAIRSAVVAAGVGILAWTMAVGVVALDAVGPRIAFLPIDGVLIGPIAAGLATFIVANALVVVYSAQVRQLRVAAHVALAAALNLAMNLVLVPSMGALGSAIATVVCYAFFLALNLFGLRSYLGRPPASAYPVAASLVLTAVVASVWSGQHAWPVATAVSAVGLTLVLPFLIRLARPLLPGR